MGFLFGKKENEPMVCNHKWKDFPWYVVLDKGYEIDRYTIRVYEPYVCVKCKKRRDEYLYGWEFDSERKFKQKVEEIKTAHADKIMDRLLLEDMIKDEQLIDREYLKVVEALENPSDAFAGLDLYGEIGRAQREIEIQTDGLQISAR